MSVQLFAVFESSPYVELAISKLEECGYGHLYAVPLDNRVRDMKLVDTMHGTDGTSLVDAGLVLAMMFGTIGVALGFEWTLGPVYGGLIGAAGGFAVGFVIDVIKNAIKRKRFGAAKSKLAPIIVIVQCAREEVEFVKQLLWNHRALGVAATTMQTAGDSGSPVWQNAGTGSSAPAGTYSSPWT